VFEMLAKGRNEKNNNIRKKQNVATKREKEKRKTNL
jgi:hypothetical protein